MRGQTYDWSVKVATQVSLRSFGANVAVARRWHPFAKPAPVGWVARLRRLTLGLIS